MARRGCVRRVMACATVGDVIGRGRGQGGKQVWRVIDEGSRAAWSSMFMWM